MTATHNALLGAFSKHSHFDELSEYLNVRGNILTPAERTALARSNLGLPPGVWTAEDAVTPGAGITSGVGTVFESERIIRGNHILTRIFIDLTGLNGGDADGDAIGATGAAHIGQITAAAFGAPCYGRMICLETPAGGADDIDLGANVSGAVANDAAVISGGTAILTAGAAWTAGVQRNFGALITADDYLYLCAGEGSGGSAYTAGRFIIEIEGSTFVGT